jgi:hypothetical protein
MGVCYSVCQHIVVNSGTRWLAAINGGRLYSSVGNAVATTAKS